MSVVGYARSSSMDQDMVLQVEALKAAGCEPIYQELKSGAGDVRWELARMLDCCRKGDVVVCTQLHRIARSVRELWQILEQLQTRGVGFRVLNNADFNAGFSAGTQMIAVLGAVAEFERDIMLECQREGIQTAKESGKYKGRKATARAVADEVLELLSQGFTKQSVADRLGIGVASVYRIVRETKI